jgi:phenylacetic acid degradation operon negative regulatory protein
MNDELRRRSVGVPAARSVLLTVLGEFLLPSRRQGVWQETLIHALGTMDYKMHAARQALARSIGEGWLIAERHGRRSRVRLSEETAAMLVSGAERIYGFGAEYAWDQHWLLVVVSVPEKRREVRHRARTQLAWAGFGSLGGGVWISPHADREGELRRLAGNGSVTELFSFHAEIGALTQPEEILNKAWDLEALSEKYRSFIARFAKLRPKTPDAVFAAQTLLVHEWRKFPFLDPDLPRELLPARWPRDRALELFRERHELWHDTAQGYFSSLEAVRNAA